MADAGTVSVQIDADWSALLAKMQQAEGEAKTAGEKVASGFATKFEASYKRFAERTSNKLSQFLNPEKVVGALADGFRTFNETGDVSDALEGAVKNIPLVGAAYDLGTQAGQALADAFMGKTENLSAGAAVAEAAGGESEAALYQRAADIEFQIQMELAREIGDERTMLRLETEKRAAEAQRAFEEANRNSLRDEERRLIQQNYDRQRELDIYLVDLKYAAIEEAEAKLAREKEEEAAKLAEKEAKAAADAAKKLADEDAKMKEQAAKKLQKEIAAEMDDMLDALDARDEEDAKRMQDEQDAELSRQQMVGTASTAIGSFRFDPYPQSDKRRNDERMVTSLEKMAAASSGGGGGFT